MFPGLGIALHMTTYYSVRSCFRMLLERYERNAIPSPLPQYSVVASFGLKPCPLPPSYIPKNVGGSGGAPGRLLYLNPLPV